MRVILLLFLLCCPVLAVAGSDDAAHEAARPCRVERLDIAFAACVDHLSDQREALMEARIGQVLSSIQAATQPELTALETRYFTSQDLWRDRVGAACPKAFPEAPRARALCRLTAIIEREAQLRLSLARAADDLGGALPHEIPVPDAVEVLVPLPGVPNGPDQTVRVPLTIPVTP